MRGNPARVLPNTCRVIKVYLNYVEIIIPMPVNLLLSASKGSDTNWMFPILNQEKPTSVQEQNMAISNKLFSTGIRPKLHCFL